MVKSLFLFAILSVVATVFAQPPPPPPPRFETPKGQDAPKGSDAPKVSAAMLGKLFPGVDIYQTIDCIKKFPSLSPPKPNSPQDSTNSKNGWTLAEEYRWFACLSDLQNLGKPCDKPEVCHYPKATKNILGCVSNKCDFLP
ncbi:hypothetical protein [Absidia glauca]|uniref:Uncharacterized protein n=1 Tax=Absidia glauca TaxID=4829 RepID=A0A163MA29_ABSGL|nr:hypothetical protein [Absidia glauca]